MAYKFSLRLTGLVLVVVVPLAVLLVVDFNLDSGSPTRSPSPVLVLLVQLLLVVVFSNWHRFELLKIQVGGSELSTASGTSTTTSSSCNEKTGTISTSY